MIRIHSFDSKRIKLLFTLPVFCLSVIFFSSCRSTLTMQVMKPADINVPTSIKTLAIANRSLPDKKSKALNIIEGVLTGEGVMADKEGSIDCLLGLDNGLRETNRFTALRPANLDLRGTGTNVFPEPLSWDEIDKICKENAADALVTLEVFDSDNKYGYRTNAVKRKDKEGKEYTEIEHLVERRTRVNTGWRLYDAKNRVIIDEFRAESNQVFGAKGTSEVDALTRLISKRDAIKKTGYIGGQLYATRISPTWITVTRTFYSKGSDGMKKANKMSRANDWDSAAEIWKQEVNNKSSKKLPGKAAYNMAVYYERMGDLDRAIEWAKKAAYDYNNKNAYSYIGILKSRLNDVHRLEQQMDN